MMGWYRIWLVALLGALLWPGAGAADAPQTPTLRAHEVMVDGHPMRVWEKPVSGARTRVLLVHGRTWSARPDFDLQVDGADVSLMDGLTALGIAPWAVDLRGYGETPRDDSGWLTPERAVADVVAVLDWLGARDAATSRTWLFGWSYGAMVSQLTAQRHADRLAGLVLFGYPVREGIDVDPEGAAGTAPRQPTTAAAAASDFILPDAVSDAVVEAFVAAALAADPVRADWRGLAQWRALDPAAVRVPTLLLEAYHDPLARDDVHQALFAGLATDDKAWVVIPGGAHAAFMERPRSYFLQQIDAFVNR